MINLIDTITLRYDYLNPYQLDKLVSWIKYNFPESYKETRTIDGTVKYNCEVNNMKVYITPQYVFISGSLHKFYIGNNIQVMDLEDVPKAFDLLNTYLGDIFDVKNAFIRRLDIGMNLLMNHKPTAYIDKLYQLSSNKTTIYNGQTFTSGNNSRSIIVYDKTEESKKKLKNKTTKIEIPDNLLRIEVSMKGRKVFEKRFGKTLPVVENFLEKINELPAILYEEYCKIQKAYVSNIDSIRNKKEFEKYLITMVGYEKCKYVVDHSFNLNLISPQNRYRINQTIKSAFKPTLVSSEKDLMIELDEKVEAWVKNAKQNNDLV